MKLILLASIFAIAVQAADKPNVFIIFPDDVGWEN
jgi:hypothetical protein